MLLWIVSKSTANPVQIFEKNRLIILLQNLLKIASSPVSNWEQTQCLVFLEEFWEVSTANYSNNSKRILFHIPYDDLLGLFSVQFS